MVITFFLSPKSSDCFYTPTNSFKPKDSFAVGNNSEKPQILTFMKLENNKCWTKNDQFCVYFADNNKNPKFTELIFFTF